VCVKQFPRRFQRLAIGDAGRHGDFQVASEPLELQVLDACLAEGSRLRRDVPEEQREELFFLTPKVDTLFVPEELHEFPRCRQSSRSISVRGSTAQPHCLHESIVMVARERDQGGVALHSTTRGYSVVPAVLGSAQIGAWSRRLAARATRRADLEGLARATRRTSARRKRRALSVRNQIVNDRPCVLTVLLIRTVVRLKIGAAGMNGQSPSHATC
jgi:hypothetical protein